MVQASKIIVEWICEFITAESEYPVLRSLGAVLAMLQTSYDFFEVY